MNRGDIKLAIDMLDGFWTDNPNDTAVIEHCINTLESCGNEISKLQVERDVALNALRMEETISFRTQMQQYAAMCDRLGEALASFDALIKYQYTGSKEAMSALQIAAWEATQPLAAWRDMKGNK